MRLNTVSLAGLLCSLTPLTVALHSAPFASAQDYEAYYLYLGGYPVAETNWSDDVQGVAHDDNNWFITNTTFLWKIPVERDLRTVTTASPGVTRHSFGSYPELASYDHFGDPDVYRYSGTDYLVVPIENGDATCTSGPPGAIAIFRCADLSYIDHVAFTGQCNDAGWVAIRLGTLFTSRQHVGAPPGSPPGTTGGLRVYDFDWNLLHTAGQAAMTFELEIPLLNEQGAGLELTTMQGGEFAPGGNLLYIISGFYTDSDALADREGIHAFETSTYRRVAHSTRGFGHFDYYYNPGFVTGAEEPEGLTIWDLDDGRAPGIRGQLHALVSDNDIDAGDVDFKHYTQVIRVDHNSNCESGTPTCPFRTLAGALNLAWSGADVRLRADSYPEHPTITRRVRLTTEGGVTRIGG